MIAYRAEKKPSADVSMSEKQIGEVEETKTVLDEGGVVPEAVADTLVPMDDVAQSTEPGVAGWLNLAGVGLCFRIIERSFIWLSIIRRS